MTENDINQDEIEIQFLMDRYHQLVDEQMLTNEIIHTTFYISIVVFGALVGVIPQTSTFITRGVLSVFASGIFFAMFLWTKTYLNSRQEITNQTAFITEQFEAAKFYFEKVYPPEAYFSEPADYRRDAWEQNWTKERLFLYYLGLSGASLIVPLIEYILYFNTDSSRLS